MMRCGAVLSPFVIILVAACVYSANISNVDELILKSYVIVL